MSITDLLAAVQQIERRAERTGEQHVISTYVEEAPLVSALRSRQNGIVTGRRGTGKTYALRYLAESERANGSFVLYIDMAHMGSTEGIYSDSRLGLSERATRLVTDVLTHITEALIDDTFLEKSDSLVDTIDAIVDHFGEVLVVEEAEQEDTASRQAERGSKTGVSLSPTEGLVLGISSSTAATTGTGSRSKVSGRVRHRIEFGQVARLMERAFSEHHAQRCWLIFDEWSSVPLDVQPYLADMLRRLFFGIPKVSVRIAAIAHRSEWRVLRDDAAGYIGAEVGAELFHLLA